jgi:hypothetical protein
MKVQLINITLLILGLTISAYMLLNVVGLFMPHHVEIICFAIIAENAFLLLILAIYQLIKYHRGE